MNSFSTTVAISYIFTVVTVIFSKKALVVTFVVTLRRTIKNQGSRQICKKHFAKRRKQSITIATAVITFFSISLLEF